MLLFWVLLWSLQPDLVLPSSRDECDFSESRGSNSPSPLLQSLRCHNDYQTHVECHWTTHRDQTLELWFKTDGGGREMCVPYRNSHCRYKTQVFSIGTKHTVFFLKNETRALCSDVKQSLHHLRARPPVNLSSHDTGDGGQRLRWSSPYSSSSSLNKNLKYQLSYRRTHEQHNWTTLNVMNTSVDLDRRSLLAPGGGFEARVRALASVGQWSSWSPVVTAHGQQANTDTHSSASNKTKDGGQLPSLHCVLHGEQEVTCSWAVSGDLAHFITYRLACGHNQTQNKLETCCVNPTVTSTPGGTTLTYSCPLNVSDVEPQLPELRPTHYVKTFEVHQHIRPKPPGDVKVREHSRNWMVEWVEPSTNKNVKRYLGYQVCYYRKAEQGSSVLVNVSAGSTSLTILGTSLVSSQGYKVKVRALIVPGTTAYRGVPSEWTEPVDWTSNEETWSYTSLIYILMSLFVTTVVFTLYFTIPACQRKVVLWVDSVPSPGKSKILSEMKINHTSWMLIQSEKTSTCKVQHLDSMSASLSNVFLWPTKDAAEEKRSGPDECCQSCNDPPPPPPAATPSPEEVNSSDTSSMSFSGPYILCQHSEPVLQSACTKKNNALSSPSPMDFTLYGEGYVWIPQRAVSMSTQDLVSHGNHGTRPSPPDSVKEDQPCPGATVQPDHPSGPNEPPNEDRPPEYSSEHFSLWPQGGSIHPSGYCQLPPPFM